MIRRIFLPCVFFIVIVISFSCSSSKKISVQKTTVVERFGLIHTDGNKIVDKNNSPIALHGMSLFWSQWGGKYYNEKCIDWLYTDWHCAVIRAAMGIEMGGYLVNPELEKKKINTVIEEAIELGIYVIVDWHDHRAQNHLEQAKTFFAGIAESYGGNANIIYEIYNEPVNADWGKDIKPYAEEVIKSIRQYDPDNLIVVGTPNWSQFVDDASRDAIYDNNVAYTYHFYTGTHDQGIRDKAAEALKNGIPIFVTEFGISEASGDGPINYEKAEQWLSFSDKNNFSTCAWSVMDKNESSAALKPGADISGGWDENDLSESGKYLRERIRKLNSKIFDSIRYPN